MGRRNKKKPANQPNSSIPAEHEITGSQVGEDPLAIAASTTPLTANSPPNTEGDSPNETDGNNWQEIYLQHRAFLLDLIKANEDQHDKAVLQLTAATLGVSVTFVDKVVTNPLPYTEAALVLGWVALTAGIIAMLASFFAGKKACRIELQNWDSHFEGNNLPENESQWSKATERLSNAGSICFVVGLVLVISFCWLNIGVPREKALNEKAMRPATHVQDT